MSQKLSSTLAMVALVVGISRFFHCRRWMMAGGPAKRPFGPMSARWARHRRWPHGPMFHKPMPPWHRGWEEPSEEKTEQAGPDVETDATEA